MKKRISNTMISCIIAVILVGCGGSDEKEKSVSDSEASKPSNHVKAKQEVPIINDDERANFHVIDLKFNGSEPRSAIDKHKVLGVSSAMSTPKMLSILNEQYHDQLRPKTKKKVLKADSGAQILLKYRSSFDNKAVSSIGKLQYGGEFDEINVQVASDKLDNVVIGIKRLFRGEPTKTPSKAALVEQVINENGKPSLASADKGYALYLYDRQGDLLELKLKGILRLTQDGITKKYCYAPPDGSPDISNFLSSHGPRPEGELNPLCSFLYLVATEADKTIETSFLDIDLARKHQELIDEVVEEAIATAKVKKSQIAL